MAGTLRSDRKLIKEQVLRLLRVCLYPSLLAASVLLAGHALVNTLRLALENEEYTHILMILPISLTFVYLEWNSLRLGGKLGVFPGLSILSVGVVITSVFRWGAPRLPVDLQLSITMLGLVTWWIGCFVLCFGTKAFRSMLFPLLFLFWMVPLPSFPLNEIIEYLQRGSSFATRVLFTGIGVPVAQNGVVLSIPGLTIEVAKECSSIRSSLMLLLTTMVLAQLLLRSPWRRALVIALAIPLSVAKNGLRIFTIAMLATRVDPGFLNGKLHHKGGIVFFAITLGVVFLLLWTLRRTEGEGTYAVALSPLGSQT